MMFVGALSNLSTFIDRVSVQSLSLMSVVITNYLQTHTLLVSCAVYIQTHSEGYSIGWPSRDTAELMAVYRCANIAPEGYVPKHSG